MESIARYRELIKRVIIRHAQIPSVSGEVRIETIFDAAQTTMPSCIRVGMACDALRAKSSILISSMVKFGSSTTVLSMGWPVNWKN